MKMLSAFCLVKMIKVFHIKIKGNRPGAIVLNFLLQTKQKIVEIRNQKRVE